jgi:hypothetical protein
MGRGRGDSRGDGTVQRRDDRHAVSAGRKGACPGCLLRSGGLPGPALGHGSREGHGQPSGQNVPPHPGPGAGIALTGCLVTGPGRQGRAHATAVVPAPGPAAATVPAWPAVRHAGRRAPAGYLVPGRNPGVRRQPRARGARTRPDQRPALRRARRGDAPPAAGRSATSARSKRSSISTARQRASARERSNRRPNICRFSRLGQDLVVTNRSLGALMTGLLGVPYSITQACHDLARLRRNGLRRRASRR